jgi:uncharacterized protein YdhG (YjbR/CyaY superfamily)
MKKVHDVDEYISGFPEEIRERLSEVRTTIRTTVPQATEAISYGMPTFKLNGKNLVHFAGFEHHIGFYPAPVGMEAFAKELGKYKTGKGSVQFPHELKLPLALISKITKFRVKGMSNKLKSKSSNK